MPSLHCRIIFNCFIWCACSCNFLRNESGNNFFVNFTNRFYSKTIFSRRKYKFALKNTKEKMSIARASDPSSRLIALCYIFRLNITAKLENLIATLKYSSKQYFKCVSTCLPLICGMRKSIYQAFTVRLFTNIRRVQLAWIRCVALLLRTIEN